MHFPLMFQMKRIHSNNLKPNQHYQVYKNKNRHLNYFPNE